MFLDIGVKHIFFSNPSGSKKRYNQFTKVIIHETIFCCNSYLFAT